MLSIGRDKWSQLVSGETVMKKCSHFRGMKTRTQWMHLLKRQFVTLPILPPLLWNKIMFCGFTCEVKRNQCYIDLKLLNCARNIKILFFKIT